MKIKKSDNIETLAKGLALLRLFGSQLTELTIQDAADCLKLSRAAARRFMITLESLGYVERSGRVFRLTPEVLKLGYSYFASLDLASLVRPVLRTLVDELQEPCGLAVLHGGDIIYLGSLYGPNQYLPRMAVGTFVPAYATAAGRVMLAGLADVELEYYLARTKFEAITPYTTTDPGELRALLLKAREQGYSVVVNELAYGTGGMAVPIVDSENTVRGALFMGLLHGVNPKAMVANYLPRLRQAGHDVSDMLRKTTGLP